jgi:hypothetical protein
LSLQKNIRLTEIEISDSVTKRNLDYFYSLVFYEMTKQLLSAIFSLSVFVVNAQQLLLIDRDHGNRVVNDSTLTVSSDDPEIIDLTMYFTMKNNTDRMLSLNLRKTVNLVADSTIDYFCFGIKCWPGTDTTNYPDTIQSGAEDYTFASHVVHYRRFDMPPLPFGKTIITYTVFDNTSFPEPVEASVTVIYNHQADLGLKEKSPVEAMVYPNPAVGVLHIIPDNDFNDAVRVYIYNTTGSLVKTIPVTLNNGSISIPVDNLNAGYYFGWLENSAKEARVFRFIR